MKAAYTQNWKMLFKLAQLDYDFDKPLTPKILGDPTHPVVRHIIYLYSMESFIYEDLNRACREKDKTKIKYYGAFAAALSHIIYSANSNRAEYKLQDKTTLYRGLKMNQYDAEAYRAGMDTNLIGYTSTSKLLSQALAFAIHESEDDERMPVVFEILFKGSQGLFELTSGFSAYPDEHEVLVQDGLKYRVTDN